MAGLYIKMQDLTVIYLTTNKHPAYFTALQRSKVIDAIGDAELISVSREPIDFGFNILDEEPQSHYNMYVQLLKACKMAFTEYIATAEDDVMYTREHYLYRPAQGVIGYDMSRWSLYWWEPVYSAKQRISNCTLIASRLEYIEALEERLAKMSPERPELISEVGRYETNLGVSHREVDKFYSASPVVQINHPSSTDHIARGARKRLGQLKAYDIPVWGKASDLLKEYR